MITAKFLKSGVGLGYGYLENEVGDIDEKAFADLEELGFVEKYVPEKPKLVKSDLPEDFPGRAKLIQSGISLLEDVKKIKDLTEINGIGKKLDDNVRKYLKENGL